MDDLFYTPAKSVQIINKVKDSKFYGSISRADTKEEVGLFLAKIKEMYNDATHNVFAYILGIGEQALKYSNDDGEPAGSSGPPILQSIEGNELSNTVIVVTRYFGGTKLGIGGLIRAYGDTANLVIEEAGKIKLTLFYKIKITINYRMFGTVMGQIEAYRAEIVDTYYTNNGVFVTVLLEADKINRLKQVLVEKTGDRIVFEEQGYIYK